MKTKFVEGSENGVTENISLEISCFGVTGLYLFCYMILILSIEFRHILHVKLKVSFKCFAF